MKRSLNVLFFSLFAMMAINGCQQSDEPSVNSVPGDVLDKLTSLGFNITDRAPIRFESGYLVEGDIYLTESDLSVMKPGSRLPVAEQYSTDNLVTSLPRNITVYIPVGGRNGFSTTYASAVDEAISRYNAENLSITFSRVSSSSGAGITFTRLAKRDERQGVLGSAGFPTAQGNPYGQIKMSGILESTYGLSVNGIATIMAHEMGHCIGFRHTDFFDRSISCGGSAYNEGDGGVGANHIPGTPTGATLSGKSWMLSCTDGGNRPFNNDDKTALDYLY